jgi:hypothetical protein
MKTPGEPRTGDEIEFVVDVTDADEQGNDMNFCAHVGGRPRPLGRGLLASTHPLSG